MTQDSITCNMIFIELKNFLKSFFASCVQDPKKLIRVFVLFACSIAVVIQISECLSKLLHPPIMSHSFFERNNSLFYPAITVCRDPPYKREVMEKYGLGPHPSITSEWKRFPFDETNLTYFWEQSTYNMSDYLTSGIGFNGSSENIHFTSRMFLMSGQCHTLIPRMSTEEIGPFSGYSMILRHDRFGQFVDAPGRLPPGWHVYLHEPKDPYTESHLHTSGRMENLYVEALEHIQVRINARVFKRTSSKKSRCIDNPLYSAIKCGDECRKEHIDKRAVCGTPWMPHMRKHECNSYTEMKQLILLYLGNQQSVDFPDCKCTLPCKEVLYSLSVIRRKPLKDLGIIWSQLDVFYTTKVIPNIHEVPSYDVSTFIADMGGSLGFLLGLSVLGLIAMLEKIAVLITRQRGSEDIDGQKYKDDIVILGEKVMRY